MRADQARAASLAVPVIEPLVASERSAPAQNVVPVWVSTTARTSASRVRGAEPIGELGDELRESALRLCGESSVIVAMPPIDDEMDEFGVGHRSPSGYVDGARTEPLTERLGLRIEARRRRDAFAEQALDDEVERAQVRQHVTPHR